MDSYGQLLASTRGALSCALLTLAVLLLSGDASAGSVGKKAPDFKAPALTDGKPVSLSAYRGKVVYLDFWASWCPPCLTALPELNELSKEFSARDFQMLAVNIDKDPDLARKFLRKHPVDYPSATDPQGKLPEKFGLETMPSSYLIDADGVVRYVHKGFKKGDIEEIRTKIREALETDHASK